MLTERFDDAFGFAHRLHRAQPRKGTSIPYISHLMTVAGLVIENRGDEDQAIAASEEAYRVAVELYREGEATTTDVIEAESERVSTTLSKVNAHIGLHAAIAQLEFATGRQAPAGKVSAP